MVTVSHIVKKIVSEQPFVEEALGRSLISVEFCRRNFSEN